MALAAFAALAVWTTWPVARHLGDALPSDLGDPMLAAWILGWDADRLRHAFHGLWNAPIFYPYLRTLAFSEHLLGIAVPAAPLVWLAGTPLVAYNVSFIASFVVAAFGMYLLADELTHRRDVSFVAGLIFGFSPARFAQISHLQVLVSGWMPLALWMLHRYLRTQSRAALAAFTGFFLVQAYSNGYDIYFLSLAAAIVIFVSLVSARLQTATRALRDLCVCAIVILLALLPVASVYFGVRHDYGQQRSEQDVTTFGADLGAYLHGSDTIAPRLATWRALPYAVRPAGPEGELFPGVLALALAFAAWWPVRRSSRGDRVPRAAYAVLAIAAVWLSLGVQPAAWGRPLPIGGVYRWLFAYFPGFDGLRVPARLSVVVSIAIAALAALGLARVTSWMTSRGRMTACAACAVLIVMESAPRALPVAYVRPHGRPDRAAYTWIRDHEAGPLLELPAGALDAKARAAQYGYQTLFHHHRIVNGFGGYDSALQNFIGGVASPLLELDRFGDAIGMLRAVGVRTIVFHPDGYADPALADATIAALRADRAQVIAETDFPDLTVFRLAPAVETPVEPDVRLVRIPTAQFTATASQSLGILDRAFDGDPDTRWLSGASQSGDEWIEIALAHPADIGRVTILTTPRSAGDYPRELLIEGAGGGAFRPLFRGSVVAALGRGLARDPTRGPIDIPLASNQTARLRLRQLGRTRRWFWAVDELQLWRR